MSKIRFPRGGSAGWFDASPGSVVLRNELWGVPPEPPGGIDGLELNFVFDSPGLQLGPVFNLAGPPSIYSIDPGETSAVVITTGVATHWRVTELPSGSPTSATAISANPFTATGLTINREYLLEVSGDGGATWPASQQFGTDNPGGGGGPIPPGFVGLSGVALASGALISKTLADTDKVVFLSPSGARTASSTAVPGARILRLDSGNYTTY